MNPCLSNPQNTALASARSEPLPCANPTRATPDETPTSGTSPALSHDDLIAQLRARGLRLTPSRSAMLAALHAHSTPVTLTQLQQALRPHRVALATLFRSMLKMEEVELVTRTIDFRGATNWELNIGRSHSFYLTDCDQDKIAPLDPVITQPLRELLSPIQTSLRAQGYRQLQLNVAFRGTAPSEPGRPTQLPAAPQCPVA